MTKSMTIFNHISLQRVKIGRWLLIATIILLCISYAYTVYEIYYSRMANYAEKTEEYLIDKTDQINLTKSPSAPLAYTSYYPDSQTIRIIKRTENIDTLFRITPDQNLRLSRCQSSYDIRDTASWNLPAIGQELIKAFEEQGLSTDFTLHLTNEQGDTIDSFVNGPDAAYTLSIPHKLKLGMLERHHLTAVFNYPLSIFWKAAGDRILIIIGLLAFLIYLIYSIFHQLRAERLTSECRKKFTHTLVHNLRSPLLLQKKQLEIMLLSDSFPEKQQEIIQQSIHKVNYILEGIEKLLSISVNAYGLKAQWEKFSLKQMLENISTNYQQNHPNKNVEITLDLDNCDEVYADPALLEGALGNLMNNSINYSDKETHILIRCRIEKKRLVLSVRDNGNGIPTQEQQQIFHENFRGEQYITDGEHKGFGLGLYYVQAVAIAHDGYITVESNGDHGSVFIIEIPQRTGRR